MSLSPEQSIVVIPTIRLYSNFKERFNDFLLSPIKLYTIYYECIETGRRIPTVFSVCSLAPLIQQTTNKIVHRPSFVGDNRDARSWLHWCTLWISECHRIVKPGGYFLRFSDWWQLPAASDALQFGNFTWRVQLPGIKLKDLEHHTRDNGKRIFKFVTHSLLLRR